MLLHDNIRQRWCWPWTPTGPWITYLVWCITNTLAFCLCFVLVGGSTLNLPCGTKHWVVEYLKNRVSIIELCKYLMYSDREKEVLVSGSCETWRITHCSAHSLKSYYKDNPSFIGTDTKWEQLENVLFQISEAREKIHLLFLCSILFGAQDQLHAIT